MAWERSNLHVSDNHRYLMEGDKPFFWLGDTAWMMLQMLNEEEIYTYLRNRKEKGFNVIQTVLMRGLPGIPVQEGASFLEEIKNTGSSKYWEFVDRILDMAEEMGLYLGLLPAWGNMVGDGILTIENIGEYAEFLGKRFQKRKNIIWILGGDVRGDVAYEVFCKEAKLLKQYNPERLITYHPHGRTGSSMWFHKEEWLDFNMFQSGHRRYDQAQLGIWDDNKVEEYFWGEDNWKYVERDHGYDSMKPTLDGEPSYEGIPQGLHNPRNPYWEEWDVRRYAYWSVFAGATGHTYGNSAIMQCYSDLSKPGAYGVREVWQDAMHHAGAGQLLHLKNLMESVDYINGRPNDEMLLYGQKERYHRIAVFAGEDFVLCYDYCGDQFMLDLQAYQDKAMDAYWMNPQDGTFSYITTLQGVDRWLASPVARKDKANDWVLVLRRR